MDALNGLGVAAALASAAAWALGSILFRRLGDTVSPVGMNLGKDLIGLPLVGLALAAWGWEPVAVGDLALLLASGLIGIAVGDTLFFGALVRLNPRQTLVLATVGQVFTVVGAVVLLGERPSPAGWVGVFLVLASVTWVLAEQAQDRRIPRENRTGILLGLGASVCFAAAVLLAKLGVRDVSALQGTFLRLIGGVSGLLLWGGARGRLGAWLRPFASPEQLRSILVAEAVIIFGGFWLGLLALKQLDATLATVLTSTEPLFVLPLTVWMLGERVSRRGALGALGAVVGVAVLTAW